MVDILDYDTAAKPVAGARMELKHPSTKAVLTHPAGKGKSARDKKPKAMYLTLLGPESAAVRRALAKIQARAESEKEDTEITEETIEADRVHDAGVLAEITVGGEVFWDGKWVTITADNAYDFYYKFALFRNQASRFALDLGNFVNS